MKGKAIGTGAQRKRGKVRGTEMGEGAKGQACRSLQVVVARGLDSLLH